MIESVIEEAGSVMLTLAAALLFEELTLGALVRLIVAPRAQSQCDLDAKRREANLPPR